MIPMRKSIDGMNDKASEFSGSGAQNESLQEFRGVMTVPMEYPGEEYGDRRPWFYSEH